MYSIFGCHHIVQHLYGNQRTQSEHKFDRNSLIIIPCVDYLKREIDLNNNMHHGYELLLVRAGKRLNNSASWAEEGGMRSHVH